LRQHPGFVPAICALALVISPALTGCENTVDGVIPVGGEESSAVEIERFVRRLHLDLTGSPPEQSALAAGVARLTGENSATTRAELVDELLATPEFAALFVGELENHVFGGETMEARYDLLCGILRVGEPACAACAPASPDVCAGCDCQPLMDLVSERAGILEANADFEAGRATTGVVERQYAGSDAFAGLEAPETVASELFEVFLGRRAEADELANAQAMIIGAFLPAAPAGLLFHRHGSNLADLIDIVFDSEVYREAVVARVFARYLGRLASPAELSHFARSLDADDPDAKSVIRAVLSSREYFEQ
jgi:hypothetical protein